MIYVLVGIAGALGAILRYVIGISLFTESSFPYATLLINLIGSFLLAWLTTNLFRRITVPPDVATAIGTGFVGSFTTFSTLSIETVELFQDGDFLFGFLYVLISFIGGLAMSRIGFRVNKEVKQS
ncbi:fluoride efflux transporter CrcB [Bacillus sp. UMB0899]|uniref:fluoride efflux transporter CrcB n=1 Tax=Metabacillus schmidteae TaxID=2730405 RepID=UPI000C7FA488|nr:fluoride efflux transporter CrcB [Metabacillus schmidteae]PMC40210.1 fluoride efflux transporter CrcB [Bacillus sp. UMB0899]